MLTHQMKLNGYVFGPLVEHWADCLDCHALGPPAAAAKTMYSVVDLRVSISPAQSASVKTCMSKALPQSDALRYNATHILQQIYH